MYCLVGLYLKLKDFQMAEKVYYNLQKFILKEW